MAHKDGKFILYALSKRSSSNLRNRLHNFAQEQKSDSILGEKIKDVEEKKTAKYKVHDNLLYFENGENNRLCLTKGIIYGIIDECHEMYASIGPSKIIKMLHDFFYYQKMAKIVMRRLASCDSCQRN